MRKFLMPWLFFRALNVKDNKLKETQTKEVFAGQLNIEKFDMSGRGNAASSLKTFNK